jgi:hypothetical protein
MLVQGEYRKKQSETARDRAGSYQLSVRGEIRKSPTVTLIPSLVWQAPKRLSEAAKVGELMGVWRNAPSGSLRWTGGHHRAGSGLVMAANAS